MPGGIGVYGVLSQFIGESRHEMGVRVALGATARDLVTLVAKYAGRLVGVGTALGVLGAIATARLIRGLLFEVSATDATIYAATVVVFLIVGACASYIPVRRATRAGPMVVLRAE